MYSRSAFTLVELLLVVAILGILVAMLVPAVQMTRASAHRIQCANNLKQLGLAILSYESARKRLPPSGIVDGPPETFDPRSGAMFSWVVSILPYLEQQPLFGRFNFSRSALDQPHDPQATHLPTMLCPSDSARNRFFVHAELTGGKRFAKGNYAAYVSPFHIDLQGRFPGALVRFGQQLSNITDGNSNTLMLSEVLTRYQEQDQRGVWALAWNGASLLAFDMHHDEEEETEPFVPSPYSFGLTQLPNNEGPNVDVLYACPDPADAQVIRMPCTIWEAETSREYLSAAPRSNHPRGVNVVFVDGHGGFLPDDVDELAMAYLVSVNDAQTVEVKRHVR